MRFVGWVVEMRWGTWGGVLWEVGGRGGLRGSGISEAAHRGGVELGKENTVKSDVRIVEARPY
ncbi:MAG TPA: hypothetical protein VMY87_02975, partial [Armatimonadota bacterium]|nr:hypothetical protein [Armatimonadota bacterium]